MTDNQNSNFNSSTFVVFIFKWRKVLLYVGLAAILLSSLFSSKLFITPKFKSTVIMFPTSTNSISQALLTQSGGGKKDILEFGAEEQAEQLLQILNSNHIRSKIISKFNLLHHYGIDSLDQYKNTKLFGEYDKNITFKRTEYMAVQVTVLDKDPQMAADLANTVADLVDSVKNQMIRERALQGFKIVEAEYHKVEKEVSRMEDSMTVLRQLGIYDYETQSEMMNQQLAKELANNNRSGIKALEEKLSILGKYGGAYVSLREALLHEKKQLSELKAKYHEAKVDAEQALPQKFIVNNAFKAEQKSYPVRWLIVLIATTSSLLLSILILITLENLGYFKYEEPDPGKKKDPVL